MSNTGNQLRQAGDGTALVALPVALKSLGEVNSGPIKSMNSSTPLMIQVPGSALSERQSEHVDSFLNQLSTHSPISTPYDVSTTTGKNCWCLKG